MKTTNPPLQEAQQIPVVDLLASAVRKTNIKEIKGILVVREDIKMSFFEGDMIVDIENVTLFIKKLLKLVSGLSSVTGYKISI